MQFQAQPPVPAPPVARSLAWPLLGAWLLLIVYASLYPFRGWRSDGIPCWSFVTAPLPYYWTWFDVVTNVLGYIPLGFLLVLGWQARHATAAAGSFWPRAARLLLLALAALLAGVALSLAMESVQCWLPARRSSNLDLLLNALGALLGALLAVLVVVTGMPAFWRRWRARYFDSRARGAQVLLLLWPCALLFPLDVPFGLGQGLEQLETGLARLLADTPYLLWLPLRAVERQPMLPEIRQLVMVLGLLAPCLLAFSAMPRRRYRWAVLLLALPVGSALTAISWWLSFGPRLAMSWQPDLLERVLPAALLAGALLLWLPQRLLCLLAIAVLVLQLWLLNEASASVYFSWALDNNLQPSFVHVYGLTRWLGLCWPWLALAWLLQRLFRPMPTYPLHPTIPA